MRKSKDNSSCHATGWESYKHTCSSFIFMNNLIYPDWRAQQSHHIWAEEWDFRCSGIKHLRTYILVINLIISVAKKSQTLVSMNSGIAVHTLELHPTDWHGIFTYDAIKRGLIDNQTSLSMQPEKTCYYTDEKKWREMYVIIPAHPHHFTQTALTCV